MHEVSVKVCVLNIQGLSHIVHEVSVKVCVLNIQGLSHNLAWFASQRLRPTL